MTGKTKITLCAFGVSVLAFLGNIGSGLCVGIPAEYRGICLGGSAVARTASDAISKRITCTAEECKGMTPGVPFSRGEENYCVCP